MLELSNVSKLYENNRGVEQLDFSIDRGEIVGFLGPNGAGKTTTMRMITGYLNPTQGNITVDGIAMGEHSSKAKQKIGYLPETPPLYHEMSVKGYLKFIANLRKVPARDQKKRINEVIDILGLHGREKQIIRSLSKGYKQRVGLAQAIIHQPDLLILDEPTSGLDPNQIIEIRQLIRDLGQKHTVLLSTHILPEVNAICNRVLIINQGKLVLDEKPERLSDSMQDRFSLRLEVSGDYDKAQEVLQGLESIDSIELDGPPPEAGKPFKLRVTSKDKADIREDIFYRLAEARLPILEMNKETQSLEDVFIKLTTNEKTETNSDENSEAKSDTAEVEKHA